MTVEIEEENTDHMEVNIKVSQAENLVHASAITGRNHVTNPLFEEQFSSAAVEEAGAAANKEIYAAADEEMVCVVETDLGKNVRPSGHQNLGPTLKPNIRDELPLKDRTNQAQENVNSMQRKAHNDVKHVAAYVSDGKQKTEEKKSSTSVLRPALANSLLLLHEGVQKIN